MELPRLTKKYFVGNTEVFLTDSYAKNFCIIAKEMGLSIPELDLSFYPTRLILKETGETFFQHSSLGWREDSDFNLIEVMYESFLEDGIDLQKL